MKSFIGDDGRWNHEARQSWIKTADTCLERARRESLDLDERQESDAAAIGTALHAVAETCVLEAQATGDPLDEDTCLEMWDREFDAIVALENFAWTKYNDAGARAFGTKCVLNWHREVLPTLDWGDALVEFEFTVPFYEDEQRVITLGGIVDYFDGTPRDLKTSGREYLAWEKKRWDPQSTAYCYALWHLGMIDSPAQFEFIVLNPKGVQRITVDRDETHFEWLKAKCVSYVKLIEANLDEWPKNDTSALCSPKWCDGWSACKGKHVGNSPW